MAGRTGPRIETLARDFFGVLIIEYFTFGGIIMSKTFMVETSARHVHVTQEDLEVLFGKGASLTKKKDLSQPGQDA